METKQVQFKISEKADKNVRLYMIENNLTDKRKAINKICEDLKNGN